MEAKELMAGDIVKQNGLILKASAIVPPYIRAEGEDGQFHEDTVEPIPLAKEIFEQNGFKKFNFHDIEGQHQWTWWLDTLTCVSLWCRELNDNPKEGWMIRIDSPLASHCSKVEFLHQLQQTLRLCHIEKNTNSTIRQTMKYIDADKIKAEIDKITESLTKSCNPDPLGTTEECMAAAEIEALGLVKSIIDEMQQETESKLQKLKKLADGMYRAAQYLTTDASHLRKAMEEYHQFVISEQNIDGYGNRRKETVRVWRKRHQPVWRDV